ncbi:hypothetical protein J6590_089582 [Homalodisca vitripennis]|nr:hypothetical protein J6590_089582 [Homalodisca vitripennis]
MTEGAGEGVPWIPRHKAELALKHLTVVQRAAADDRDTLCGLVLQQTSCCAKQMGHNIIIVSSRTTSNLSGDKDSRLSSWAHSPKSLSSSITLKASSTLITLGSVITRRYPPISCHLLPLPKLLDLILTLRRLPRVTTARRDTHLAGWTPPRPLSSRSWLPRAPHLDDDPTALPDPEVTLTDSFPLLQTAGNGPRRHNM